MGLGRGLVFFTIAAIVASVGACKSSLNNTNNQGAVVVSSCSTNCSTPTFSGGATTVLNIVSSSVFNQYVGVPVNLVPPVYLNVNTSSNSGVYLGESNIRYTDSSGVSHTGHFTNGTDTSHGNNVHILTTDQDTGTPTYRFYFEDPAGVIIITLQNEGTGTDTQFSNTLSGIVYFRNFNTIAPNPLYQPYYDYLGNYWPPNPYAFCWSGQITTGPYDCRNGRVQPSSSGSTAVTKLGTFVGLSKAALGL